MGLHSSGHSKGVGLETCWLKSNFPWEYTILNCLHKTH